MGLKRDVKEARSWPGVANIGLTTRCNARCPMCHAKQSGSDMKLKTLMELIRQLATGPVDRFQWVGNLGEPLMSGMLPLAIEAAHKLCPNAAQGIFTNASMLVPALSRKLTTCGLTDITFSVDSLDPTIYSKLRPGLDLGVVMKNIETFLGLNERTRPPVHTRVHAVAVPENYGDIAKMRNYWAGKVDEFSWLPCDGRGPTPRLYEEGDDFPCWSPFTGIFVEPNGTFLFCCQDGLAKYPVGKFPEESVADIWNGLRYAAVRKAHLAGTKRIELPLCANCHTYY